MHLSKTLGILTESENEVKKYAYSIGIKKVSIDYLKNVVIPLTLDLLDKRKHGTFKFYISGGQGSGKSTIAKFIKFYLERYFNLNVVSFSLDDIYFSKKSRLRLSKEVHPLLITRGVPGTHDVKKGIKIIRSLVSKNNHKTVLPIFSKLDDDIATKDNWVTFNGTPDFIIFDGWCVGAEAQPEKNWKSPINKLEEKHDKDGKWSRWVNKQLAGRYQELFNIFDLSIYIKSKSFDQIIKNRWEQELSNLSIASKNVKTEHLKSFNDIYNFTMHFERITKEMEFYMPIKSDILLMRHSKTKFSIIKK